MARVISWQNLSEGPWWENVLSLSAFTAKLHCIWKLKETFEEKKPGKKNKFMKKGRQAMLLLTFGFWNVIQHRQKFYTLETYLMHTKLAYGWVQTWKSYTNLPTNLTSMGTLNFWLNFHHFLKPHTVYKYIMGRDFLQLAFFHPKWKHP